MPTEAILPNTELSSFVNGYFLIDIENSDDEIPIRTYESGISLGIPFGKPFKFHIGEPELDEKDNPIYHDFDKPFLFYNVTGEDTFWVKGDARMIFVVFTELGLQLFLNDKNPKYEEHLFPLSRLGIPIFNLMVKRKLRYNQDNHSGIQIIEDELKRFFKKFHMEESHEEEFDLDTDFPFVP
ncbi:hypothetical protein [Fontibacter flavus]|uniref:Uncharacterized protein n=1 Tax=Fontibacter flavus TaxID=654838 RepID=A0ABV6FSN0_9BACT|nr:hypothetical protein [Cyclobacteriaceae bacterium]